MGKSSVDFVIGTHAQNDVLGATANSVQMLRLKGYKFIWDIVGAGGAARTRNIIATRVLRQSVAPYLIFMDRDITFKPEDYEHILEDLRGGYDMVGGCYAVKNGSQLASFGLDDGSIILDGTVREIRWLASGFMGISRELLQKMVDELKLPLMHKGDWSEAYPFFEQRRYRENGKWMWLTEDYDFCDKVRKVGNKVYLDTKIWLGHIGDYTYKVQHAIKHAMESTTQSGIRAEAERLRNIVYDLSEFTGQSKAQIKPKVEEGVSKQLKQAWIGHTGTTEDFYRNNKLYLFDLANFNLQAGYLGQRCAPLLGVIKKKVLDIGCGIGTTCFILLGQGNEVTGYDINKVTIDFCKFKAKKHNLGVNFTTELPADLAQFDVITAIDTLEHIEDLRSFLLMLGKGMSRGAKFYHNDEWGHQDTIPMHFNHSEHIDEWLTEAGFVLFDVHWAIKT